MDNNGTRKIVAEDNFFSPANHSFYSAVPSPYATLHNSKQEIRLLRFKSTDQAQGRLEVELLDNVSIPAMDFKYAALSYAAGSHKDTEEILVNGKVFNAFRTISTALRSIRDNKYADEVWADQICINQSNIKERAYQVDHMRDIYQHACCTIVYLSEDIQISQGFKLLERVFEQYESSMVDQDMEAGSQISHRGVPAAKWLLEHAKDPANLEILQSAYEVYDTSWWHRGWICQEVIVADEALLIHGGSKMDAYPFISPTPSSRLPLF